MHIENEGVHMPVSSIGLDIAKHHFHFVVKDANGKSVQRKHLKRHQVLPYFAKREERDVVGIETCSGAHYWARKLEALGYPVKLMSPKAVKAYRTKTKNDFNDAEAIAESATRENVRAIALKSAVQQEHQALHRTRELLKKQRNQAANHLRGLVAEYGIVIAQTFKAVHTQVPEILEDAENGLSMALREHLALLYEMLCTHEAWFQAHEQRLKAAQARDPQAQRLAQIHGVGVLTSSAVVALHGNLEQFARSRDFSAAIGLVPRQNSTGGRNTLLGINKHTDPYLRTLFIHGARSVLASAAKRPDDPLCRWALRVRERRGFNIAAVALANKLARIAWAVLVRGQDYDPNKLRALPH